MDTIDPTDPAVRRSILHLQQSTDALNQTLLRLLKETTPRRRSVNLLAQIGETPIPRRQLAKSAPFLSSTDIDALLDPYIKSGEIEAMSQHVKSGKGRRAVFYRRVKRGE